MTEKFEGNRSRPPQFQQGVVVEYPMTGITFTVHRTRWDSTEQGWYYLDRGGWVAEHELRLKGAGRKFDAGKEPLSLIPVRAQLEEAKVLAYGATKYDPWNWAKGMPWSRLLDAAQRHILAFQNGEDLDPETGHSHLAHARCCLGFLLDYEESHREQDDRRRTRKETE